MGTAFNWVVLIITFVLVYTFMLRGFAYGETAADATMATRSDDDVQFTITDADSNGDVIKNLEKQGIIANSMLFRLENIFSASDTKYKPGTYTLKPDMTAGQINSILSGKTSANQITIKIQDGFTVNDIAEYLASNDIVATDKFLWACNNHKYAYDFLNSIPVRDNKLEGYLAPGTYTLSEAPTPDEIINKLLSNFQDTYENKFQSLAEQKGYTMDQVVTIASLLEKEYKLSSERPKGAEVLYNRLGQQLNLRMSSTLVYALNIRRDTLTKDDLDTDSPYNTYNHAGLPEGPICNPGEDALTAALNPASGDLLYSLLKDDTSGEHAFASTEEEYNNLKSQYNEVYN
jgi:UPF0755 protein